MNQELKANEDSKPGYISLEKKIKLSMKIIFDNHVKYKKNEKAGTQEILEDRLCIMAYRRNVRKLFNLISIRKNNTQLKN